LPRRFRLPAGRRARTRVPSPCPRLPPASLTQPGLAENEAPGLRDPAGGVPCIAPNRARGATVARLNIERPLGTRRGTARDAHDHGRFRCALDCPSLGGRPGFRCAEEFEALVTGSSPGLHPPVPTSHRLFVKTALSSVEHASHRKGRAARPPRPVASSLESVHHSGDGLAPRILPRHGRVSKLIELAHSSHSVSA